MDPITAYYKKTIHYTYNTIELEFMVSQELFSSYDIDHGTQRLLRTILFEQIHSFKKVLDLGCGYGPIGITLKKISPDAEVHLIDTDALALEYARANTKLNGITDGVMIYASLGYDGVTDTDFDLIVSNIPAKVGNHAISHLLKQARVHLTNNGRVVIVVVDAINEYVHSELTADETIKILYHHAWPGHHVYHYTFTEQSQQRTNYPISVTENGSYDADVLAAYLRKVKHHFATILIINPSMGTIPLEKLQHLHPQKIVLVDRDLVALPTYHQVGIKIETKVNAIIGVLPEQQNGAVYQMIIEQAAEIVLADGYCILASSATVMNRIEAVSNQLKRFVVLDKIKDKGRSLIVLQKL